MKPIKCAATVNSKLTSTKSVYTTVSMSKRKMSQNAKDPPQTFPTNQILFCGTNPSSMSNYTDPAHHDFSPPIKYLSANGMTFVKYDPRYVKLLTNTSMYKEITIVPTTLSAIRNIEIDRKLEPPKVQISIQMNKTSNTNFDRSTLLQPSNELAVLATTIHRPCSIKKIEKLAAKTAIMPVLIPIARGRTHNVSQYISPADSTENRPFTVDVKTAELTTKATENASLNIESVPSTSQNRSLFSNTRSRNQCQHPATVASWNNLCQIQQSESSFNTTCAPAKIYNTFFETNVTATKDNMNECKARVVVKDQHFNIVTTTPNTFSLATEMNTFNAILNRNNSLPCGSVTATKANVTLEELLAIPIDDLYPSGDIDISEYM